MTSPMSFVWFLRGACHYDAIVTWRSAISHVWFVWRHCLCGKLKKSVVRSGGFRFQTVVPAQSLRPSVRTWPCWRYLPDSRTKRYRSVGILLCQWRHRQPFLCWSRESWWFYRNNPETAFQRNLCRDHQEDGTYLLVYLFDLFRITVLFHAARLGNGRIQVQPVGVAMVSAAMELEIKHSHEKKTLLLVLGSEKKCHDCFACDIDTKTWNYGLPLEVGK